MSAATLELPEEVQAVLADPEKLERLLAVANPQRERRKLVSKTEIPSCPLANLPEAVGGMLSRMKPSSASELREHAWRTEIREHLKASGLPQRFWFEIKKWHPDQRKVFDICQERLRNVGAIIALVGPRGTGKTTIASQLIIGRAWDETLEPWCRRPPYRKALALISKLKPIYSDFGSVQSENLRQYVEDFCKLHPLVILDETGEVEDMKVQDRLITDILDRRYSHRNDTILISNQTFEDFVQRTNPSTLSRLEEHGEIIVCDWPSFRAKGDRNDADVIRELQQRREVTATK